MQLKPIVRTNRRRMRRSLDLLRTLNATRLMRAAELELAEHDGDARRRVDPKQIRRRA